MSNTIPSPNMNLPVPIVGVDPGPDWANNYNAALSILDQHNHSPGSGVQITPAGLNINGNLTFNGNNAIQLRTTRFTPQSAALSAGADIGCLYEVGADLYYNDGVGNQIRMTQGGSVSGASGTITGLPSGTASAAYSSGTFTFQSATSTPAALNVGPITIGQQVASPQQITIQSPNSLGASYTLTLPTAPPGVTSFMFLGTSGNISASNTAATLTLTTLTVSGGATITGGETTDNLAVTSGTITLATAGFATHIGVPTSGSFPGGLYTDAPVLYLGALPTAVPTSGGLSTFSGNTLTAVSPAFVSRPIVVSATTHGAGANGLMIVRGTVAATASALTSGEGATVSYNSGTEVYTVSFSSAFQDVPAVTVTPLLPGSNFFNSAAVGALTVNGFTCTAGTTNSGFVTSGFSFIAIGQRGA